MKPRTYTLSCFSLLTLFATLALLDSASAQSPPRINTGSIRVELLPVTYANAPVDLVTPNDGSGRLFIVGQNGQIVLLKNGRVADTPFLDVSSRLVALNQDYDERGLLGLAFHPGFKDPSSPGFRKFYTYTSEPVLGTADFTVPMSGSPDHHAVIAEWQASTNNADVADPATRREVMRIAHPQPEHNGGKLAFRPSDKYLYIALGDGGSNRDVGDGHTPGKGNAQDLTNVLGKILRIDPLAPNLTPASTDPVSANAKYRVPKSNPFVGGGGRGEIYAYGLRNPYRFSFDPVGDRLVAADVGEDSVEEVDVIAAGKNYGWNRKEGSFLFNTSTGKISVDPAPDPALINPVAEYSHQDGEAVIGGFVYRGTALPHLTGQYVFGDLGFENGGKGGRLFYTNLNDGVIHELQYDSLNGSFLKGFGQDADGEIYLLAGALGPFEGGSGLVYKLAPTLPRLPSFKTLYDSSATGQLRNFIAGGDGNFYGTAGAVVFRMTPGGDFTTLHTFTGNEGTPYALALASDGNFYGVASGGAPPGLGNIFKISSTGVLTTLHNFSQADGFPAPSALVQATDGNLYGATPSGGTTGFGVILQLTPAGALTKLYTFSGPDGKYPGSLVAGSDGNLYGTTGEGGTSGRGTLFKLTTKAPVTLTTLHTFINTFAGLQGFYPITKGKDGSLYGIDNGDGTTPGIIFKVTTDGVYSVVYTFTKKEDGSLALTLIPGTDGNLYGISDGTRTVGSRTEKGIIFQLTLTGVFNILYGFDSSGTEGNPFVGEPVLLQTRDGNLYGITAGGGASGRGTIFRLITDQTLAVLNISTRLPVQSGDNVLIAGFIITGSDAKKVIIRGIGPSLGAAGVQGALADPTLELHGGDSKLLASNDNWKTRPDGTSQQAEIEATTIQPTNDLESAIVQTLAPGAYTAIVRGKNNTTGIGLVEVYDLTDQNSSSASKLANISTRGFVNTGDNVMIGGFIVGARGIGTSKVIVRGIGPSLAKAGVSGVLQDPTLELHDATGAVVAANDNWKDTQQAEIEATTIPPTENEESAIVADLAPGPYTVILRGKGNATGIGLVETYSLQ